MIIEMKSVTIRLMAEDHRIEDGKMIFEDRGEYLAEIPLDQIVKITDWGRVTYEAGKAQQDVLK